MSLYNKFIDWLSSRSGRGNVYLFGDLRSAFNAGYSLRNKEMRAAIKVHQDRSILADEQLFADEINKIAESRRGE